MKEDINNSHMLLANNFVQTLVRPFKSENLSTLKLGSTVIYQAGFKIWADSEATEPLYTGYSAQSKYTVQESASALVASVAALSLASAVF